MMDGTNEITLNCLGVLAIGRTKSESRDRRLRNEKEYNPLAKALFNFNARDKSLHRDLRQLIDKTSDIGLIIDLLHVTYGIT